MHQPKADGITYNYIHNVNISINNINSVNPC